MPVLSTSKAIQQLTCYLVNCLMYSVAAIQGQPSYDIVQAISLQSPAIAQMLFNELLISGVNPFYPGAVALQRVIVLKY